MFITKKLDLLLTSVLFSISLFLFRLPMLFKDNIGVLIGTLLLFWLFILYNFFQLMQRKKKYTDKSNYFISVVSILLLYPFVISLFFLNDEVSYIIGKLVYFLTIILFALFSIPVIVKQKNLIFKLIYINILLYLFFNFFLDFLGFERIEGFNDSIGNGQIANVFSLEIRRRLLPLASSINSFGVITSCFLVTTILLWFKNLKNLLYPILIIFSGYLLLVADTRSALALGLFFIVSFIFYKLVIINLSRIIFILWIFAPFLITIIATSDLEIFNLVKRPGEKSDDFIRASVWILSIETITEMNINSFIGYGFRGNLNSGIASNIQKLIKMDVDVPTSHNFVIQTIIDFGILGMLIYLTFINKVLKIARRYSTNRESGNYYWKVLFVVLLMIMMSGINEAIPSYYSDDLFIIFIYISFGIYFIEEEMKINYSISRLRHNFE